MRTIFLSTLMMLLFARPAFSTSQSFLNEPAGECGDLVSFDSLPARIKDIDAAITASVVDISASDAAALKWIIAEVRPISKQVWSIGGISSLGEVEDHVAAISGYLRSQPSLKFVSPAVFVRFFALAVTESARELDTFAQGMNLYVDSSLRLYELYVSFLISARHMQRLDHLSFKKSDFDYMRKAMAWASDLPLHRAELRAMMALWRGYDWRSAITDFNYPIPNMPRNPSGSIDSLDQGHRSQSGRSIREQALRRSFQELVSQQDSKGSQAQ